MLHSDLGVDTVAAQARTSARAPYGQLSDAMHRQLRSLPVPQRDPGHAPPCGNARRNVVADVENSSALHPSVPLSALAQSTGSSASALPSWSACHTQQELPDPVGACAPEQASREPSDDPTSPSSDLGETKAAMHHGLADASGAQVAAGFESTGHGLVAPLFSNAAHASPAQPACEESTLQSAARATPLNPTLLDARTADDQRSPSFYEAAMAAAAHKQREQAQVIVDKVATVCPLLTSMGLQAAKWRTVRHQVLVHNHGHFGITFLGGVVMWVGTWCARCRW